MRKYFIRGIFFIFIICLQYTVNIYGLEFLDTASYTENFEIEVLTKNILIELEKFDKTDILKYSFKVSFNSNETLEEKLKYGKELQLKLIEELDGVLVITPDIKTKLQENTFEITLKKYIPDDKEYINILNTLVEQGNKEVGERNKLYVLNNYLYENGYKYSNTEKYMNITSSKVTEFNICMPDGVLKNKEGICSGYTNLMSVYCEKLDIPCIKVRGYLNGVYHVINFVYLKENGVFDWYAVDNLFSLKKKNNLNLIMKIENYQKYGFKYDKDLVEKIKKLKYSELELKIYENKNYFIDLDGYKYKNEIVEMYSKGYISGYTDRSFRPNNKITKIEFLHLLLSPFDDKIIDSIEYKYWWEKYYYFAVRSRILENLEFSVDNFYEGITYTEGLRILENLSYVFFGAPLSLDIENLMKSFDMSRYITRGDSAFVVYNLIGSV